MHPRLLGDASLWTFLFAVDQDLANYVRQEGCSCGGHLHSANYRRKPRGGPANLPAEVELRLSFCCEREGCRKRCTPASVRFLGRKVYLHAVIVLVAAMQQGPSPRRVRELSQLCGADRRTLARWQVFWREQFPRTSFWKVARGFLAPVIEVAVLPLRLVQAFLGEDTNCREEWRRLLLFLAPITITGGLRIAVG